MTRSPILGRVEGITKDPRPAGADRSGSEHQNTSQYARVDINSAQGGIFTAALALTSSCSSNTTRATQIRQLVATPQKTDRRWRQAPLHHKRPVRNSSAAAPLLVYSFCLHHIPPVAAEMLSTLVEMVVMDIFDDQRMTIAMNIYR